MEIKEFYERKLNILSNDLENFRGSLTERLENIRKMTQCVLKKNKNLSNH